MSFSLSLFLSSFRVNSRNFSSSSSFGKHLVDDPRQLLGFVRDHSNLGFRDLHFPLSLFHRMISLPRRPSIVDFTRLFSAILKLKRLSPHSTVISLYSQLGLSGTRPDSHSIGILMNCYCHLGRLDFGFSLLAKSLKLGYPFENNCFLFTTLINGYIHNDQLPHAVNLLDKVVLKLGIQPTLVTYGTMIKGLCGIGDNAAALKLLRRMNSSPSSCKPNVVIDSLCKDRLSSEALKLFSIMKNEGIKPNVNTYNSLIRGMFNLGLKDEAKDMLSEMLDTNIAPSVATYSMLVDMHCKEGLIDDAEAILKRMIEQGLKPNVITYNALLDGYCSGRQMDKARDLIDLMLQNQCQPDVVTFTTLINGYIKLKNLDEAFDVLQEMFEKGIHPDVVVYSTLIDGLCKSNRIPKARQLLNDMRIYGIKPDVCTYGSLLDGLCKSAQLDEAVGVLEEMECNGVAPNSVICNILIDSLCEAGQMKDAQNLVSDLQSRGFIPDQKTYNIMIKGLCKKGLMIEVVELLNKMKQRGCSPDEITFNTIVRGFIINKDLQNAIFYRDLMVNKGFEADVDTMSLFVDHLSHDNPEFLQKFLK